MKNRIDSTRSSLSAAAGAAFAAFLVGCGGGDNAGIAAVSPNVLSPMLVACESDTNRRYKATILDSLGGTYSFAYAINNHGQVVGNSSTPGDLAAHATIWNGSTPTALLAGGDMAGFAYDVNDAGQAVGESTNMQNEQRPISWFRAGATDLETQGGSQPGSSLALGINNAGQIVGVTSTAASAQSIATLWSGGRLSILGTLGGAFSIASSINDSDEIVGYSTNAENTERATLWKNGSPVDLGTLGGAASKARAINNPGQIVGESDTPLGNGSPYFTTHATLWHQGTVTDLGTLGGTFSRANAINNSGQIVGWSTTPDERPHATIWYGTTAVDLGTLLDESGAGMTIGDPVDINDRGQIVARALLQDGSTGVMVLTPTACQQ